MARALTLVILLATAQVYNTLQPVYLASFLEHLDTSSSNESQWRSQTKQVDLAETAVDYINNRSDLLPGHQLVLVQGGPVCASSGEAAISYLQFLHGTRQLVSGGGSGPGVSVVGMVGPPCSRTQVETLAYLANRPNISLPQVHLSMLSSLGNRERYPNTYGILGSSEDLVNTVIALIRENNWNVSVLYEEEDILFQKMFQHLYGAVKSRVKYVSQVRADYMRLDALSGGLVVLLTHWPLTRAVLCGANQKGRVYRDYHWILVGGEQEQLRDYSNSCSIETITAALRKVLFVNFRTTGIASSSDNVNSSFTDSKQNYDNNDINIDSCQMITQTSSLIFDAIWTMALALNKTLDDSQCTYLPSCVSKHLPRVEFNGLSGYISFDKGTGFNRRTVDIYQLSNSTTNLNMIGSFHNGTLLFSGDFQLQDIGLEYPTIQIEVAILFTLLTLIQLSITAILHTLTVVYQKHPCVRASNPKLSHLVFTGCYVIVVTELVFLWPLKTLSIQGSRATICLVMNAWMLPFGLSLVSSPLIAHIWRLYRISTHFTNPGRWISDRALTTIIATLLAVDVLIGLFWTVLTPTYLVYIDKGTVNKRGMTQVTTMCVQSSPLWYISMWVYKLFQLSTLLILCLLTKNIKVNRNFATSRFKMVSYLIILSASVFLPAYFILYLKNAEIHADVVVMSLLANTFLLLCNVFILFPPVYQAVKEKKHKSHYSSAVIL